MSRFLFAVPPLAGHVNPTIAVGQELAGRGHAVAWVGHPGVVGALLPAGCDLFAAGESMPAAHLDQMHARWRGLQGWAALKALWEEVLLPVGDAMVGGVEAAVSSFQPDVLVADQQALAGAVVARRRGMAWATSATTFSELTRPYAGMPKVEDWVRDLVIAFAERHGLTGADARRSDLRFSDALVLVYATQELAGPVEVACTPAFVGPAIGPRPSDAGFAWEWLDGRPRVLVTLGTQNGDAGARFFGVVAHVAAARPGVQFVLSAPPSARPEGLPANVLVCGRIPQLALLTEIDAVVCHGGYNTVAEALAAGRPVVVAPIRDDQPLIADRVVANGAGLRVSFRRARAEQLGTAVDAVLDDSSFREAAARLAASFALAGGARAAADRLEKLA
ncbi:MAG TPA: glycosyltransferase [Actinomycetota bacterium]|nr:glycosyltransferase [Actinomycetota bacterium]